VKRTTLAGASLIKKSAIISILASLIGGVPATFAQGAGDAQATEPEEVVVWTYDSFVSEWGTGPVVQKSFEQTTGTKVRFVAQGDGGALVAKVLALKDQSSGRAPDVILGFDQNLMAKLMAPDLLVHYKPAGADRIPADLVVDPSWRSVPYDYGQFAIIYDSDKITTPPASLEDLTDAQYKKSLILMDPRTSTPGLGFLAWTIASYGDGWTDYWRRLIPSILTIADGWDSGYGLFTSGEAPMVLSYTTSPAYHKEYESTERYKAAVFSAGHPAQIECAGIYSRAPNRKGAERFMDFMVSDAFQSAIPLTNWMYPAVNLATMPASYDIAPKPPLIQAPAPDAKVLDTWASVVTKGGSN